MRQKDTQTDRYLETFEQGIDRSQIDRKTDRKSQWFVANAIHSRNIVRWIDRQMDDMLLQGRRHQRGQALQKQPGPSGKGGLIAREIDRKIDRQIDKQILR